MQAPPQQPQPAGQAAEHAPQCSMSVLVARHAPSQQVCPASQRPVQSQRPSTQGHPPSQAASQAPQWDGFVIVFTQDVPQQLSAAAAHPSSSSVSLQFWSAPSQ